MPDLLVAKGEKMPGGEVARLVAGSAGPDDAGRDKARKSAQRQHRNVSGDGLGALVDGLREDNPVNALFEQRVDCARDPAGVAFECV